MPEDEEESFTIVCGGDVVDSRTSEFWGYSRVTPTDLCGYMKYQGTTTTPRMTVWRDNDPHGSKY